MATSRKARRVDVITGDCPACGTRIIIDSDTHEIEAYASARKAVDPEPPAPPVAEKESESNPPQDPPEPAPADDEEDTFLSGW